MAGVIICLLAARRIQLSVCVHSEWREGEGGIEGEGCRERRVMFEAAPALLHV